MLGVDPAIAFYLLGLAAAIIAFRAKDPPPLVLFPCRLHLGTFDNADARFALSAAGPHKDGPAVIWLFAPLWALVLAASLSNWGSRGTSAL